MSRCHLRFRNILFRLVAAGATGCLGLALYWQVDPVGFRLLFIQPAIEVLYFMRELDPLDQWSMIERQVIEEPERIALEEQGKLRLVGGLYSPHGAGPFPAIILNHGSSPYGRKAGLVRALGMALQARGWLVLAPDARGFGESDDPQDLDNPDAYEVGSDYARWVDYLESRPDVDPARLYVFGHSLGANFALESALDDKRVKALILMGPERYLRGLDEQPSRWNRVRASADRRLPQLVSPEVLLHSRKRNGIPVLVDARLSQPGHTPTLLIDGELESKESLKYLAAIASRCASPFVYYTLPGSGHYAGVRSFFGSSTVYVRTDIFGRLVDLVVAFVDKQGNVETTALANADYPEPRSPEGAR